MRTRFWKVTHVLAFVLLAGAGFLAAGCGRQESILPGVNTPIPWRTTIPTNNSNKPSEVEAAPALKAPETSSDRAADSQPLQDPTVQPTIDSSEPGWSSISPCAETDCGKLVVTHLGQPQRVGVQENGILPQAQFSPLPADISADGRWIVDTGLPSPDGNSIAYTSIGYEAGAPIFLHNLRSGEWLNLIDAVNQRLGSEAALPMDYWWDVIGWFPDSQRLMIGPGDLSFVAVVELSSHTAQIIPFPGAGRGGRMFVNLAADGNRFIFTGEDSSGLQTLNAFDLASGEITPLYKQPYDQGFLTNPRLAPDGKSIAYVNQVGSAGISTLGSVGSDTLNLLSLDGSEPAKLVEGSLWMAVPTWSPDGQRLAFAMADDGAPTPSISAVEAGDEQPAEVRGNVWVVTSSGEAQQITFVDGLARSPVWSPDGKTLAFVTHDGQVGLANADQPGDMWQATGPSEEAPELISAFFLQ